MADKQDGKLPDVAHAETLAQWISSLTPEALPAPVKAMSRDLLLDVLGLCVAARHEDYIQAITGTVDGTGNCTAFGHKGSYSAYDAAFINGTAAHGEDFDDTFEGGPVHSGAVIVPAVLAACEKEGLDGDRLLLGIAAGAEMLCRSGLVTPKAIHAAGFHPTAVLGALAAAAGVSAALGFDAKTTTNAIGIAGSMASGIIEYLAEGTWTKRAHAGWSAQAGIRAALMARGGFLGPRTVLEGSHGFFKAFAPTCKPEFEHLVGDLGKRWVMTDIAFKPYACGTMTQPYIDCAIKLAKQGVKASEIESLSCKVGEGTVHRLWEVLATKQTPKTPYSAKFSTPFCIAVGLLDGRAGFSQFTEARIRDPELLKLTSKITYVIDPENPYPSRFTGDIKATLTDGRVIETHQDNMRGGSHDPLDDGELEQKFVDNALYGGWTKDEADKGRDWCVKAFEAGAIKGAAAFRG